MKIQLILLCCFWHVLGLAQDTIFLKDLGREGLADSRDSAHFYKLITKTGDLYDLKVFRMDHDLYLSGTLESVSPEVEHGDFVYYFPNGKVYKSGKFEHGEKEGEWIYNNYHYELSRKLYYKAGVLIKEQCYYRKEIAVKCQERRAEEIMPEYPGGTDALMKYLMANVVYPKPCRDSMIQGKVIVKFYLEIDGTVHGARIIRSVHPLLDEEALRVVNSMPAWSPGVQRGEYVRVYYTLPITFKLQ